MVARQLNEPPLSYGEHPVTAGNRPGEVGCLTDAAGLPRVAVVVQIDNPKLAGIHATAAK